MTKYKNLSILIFLVILPVVFLLLPASFFDNKTSICLSVLLFDQKCYGCGLTRGTMHLINFNFKNAWEYNPLCFITTPLISTIWAYYIYSYYKKVRKNFSS